jgi:predicted aspartyl protease
MSPNRSFTRIFVVLALAICAPGFAAALDQTQPTPQIVTARIKLDDLSMIIVPVSINGSGPYDFMLDTGCSKSIVDKRLADQLGLSRVSGKTVVGMLASAQMSVVHADSLSVAGATVGGGDILSTDHLATISNMARGVLGEDFLRNFDVLIDYRHQVIRLESALGPMAETAVGERLPLQLTATYHEKLTYNRLVICGHIREFGDATLSVLLDSGANRLTLFRDDLGPGENQAEPIRAGSFNRWVTSSAATRRIRSLDLGTNSVPDLTVIALSRRADVDSDGLIPTSFFHSVFISHFGRFVILNPSFPKTGRDAPATFAAR